jgi:hypothetical protein
MQDLNSDQIVIEKSTFSEIKGAEKVDLGTNAVLIRRKDHEGKEELTTSYYPAGVAIVRRR